MWTNHTFPAILLRFDYNENILFHCFDFLNYYFFFSTQLFREFKLCKLLLRPLDDRYSASRVSSQQIRGYSRQSESYVSSLSNSADNSAHDEIDDDDMGFGEGQYRYSALFPYQRPGSRAYSVPNRICLGSGRCSSIIMSLPFTKPCCCNSS